MQFIYCSNDIENVEDLVAAFEAGTMFKPGVTAPVTFLCLYIRSYGNTKAVAGSVGFLPIFASAEFNIYAHWVAVVECLGYRYGRVKPNDLIEVL